MVCFFFFVVVSKVTTDVILVSWTLRPMQRMSWVSVLYAFDVGCQAGFGLNSIFRMYILVELAEQYLVFGDVD